MSDIEATLTFQGQASRRLREGMRIAEAVVRVATRMVGCRLIWRPGAEQPELLATEGARLAQVVLKGATRDSDKELFDVALPIEGIKRLARTMRAPTVRISRRTVKDSYGPIVHIGEETTEAAEWSAATTYPLDTFERLIDGGNQAILAPHVIRMNRREALEMVRKNGPYKGVHNYHRVCRMESSRDALRIWGTLERELRDSDDKGGRVAPGDENADNAIVFGIRHPLLMDTLRTMTGETSVLTVARFDMPLRMENDEGSERFLIMTSRLDGRDPHLD